MPNMYYQHTLKHPLITFVSALRRGSAPFPVRETVVLHVLHVLLQLEVEKAEVLLVLLRLVESDLLQPGLRSPCSLLVHVSTAHAARLTRLTRFACVFTAASTLQLATPLRVVRFTDKYVERYNTTQTGENINFSMDIMEI